MMEIHLNRNNFRAENVSENSECIISSVLVEGILEEGFQALELVQGIGQHEG